MKKDIQTGLINTELTVKQAQLAERMNLQEGRLNEFGPVEKMPEEERKKHASTQKSIEKDLLDSCQLELLESDSFENQYVMHSSFFKDGFCNYEPNLERCLTGADLILHLTEWREYRDLDPKIIGELVRTKNLIDGRNVLDRDKYREAGWHFHALGRSN